MIAAIVGGGVVVLAVVAFAWWAIVAQRDTERRCADSRVETQVALGKLAIEASNTKTQLERAEREKERADALDAELDQVALDGDASGARDRVLRRQARERAREGSRSAGGSGAGGVLAGGPDPGVASRSDDALARPGD